jgi:hypothetical protein
MKVTKEFNIEKIWVPPTYWESEKPEHEDLQGTNYNYKEVETLNYGSNHIKPKIAKNSDSSEEEQSSSSESSEEEKKLKKKRKRKSKKKKKKKKDSSDESEEESGEEEEKDKGNQMGVMKGVGEKERRESRLGVVGQLVNPYENEDSDDEDEFSVAPEWEN